LQFADVVQREIIRTVRLDLRRGLETLDRPGAGVEDEA
jgi:hypothetical protein